jgi:acetyl-CoA carboxylase biotin carboxyl carrier protein
MDLKRVEELIELMRESGVSQLSLEVPDFKVSITRGPQATFAPQATLAPQGTEVSGLGPQAAPEPTTASAEHPASAFTSGEASGLSVVSPVVGVFHNGGMLDPREMVRAGDRVREGQLLAAIEAMKVPNELRAPVSGLVTQLLVDDGSAVEYGQTLFVIAPDERGEGSDAEPPIGLA